MTGTTYGRQAWLNLPADAAPIYLARAPLITEIN